MTTRLLARASVLFVLLFTLCGAAFANNSWIGTLLDAGGKPLDIPRLIQAAHTGASSLVADGAHYSVAAASPREVAQILDAIFRHHFGMRPFPDEDDDYAVGAEW